MLFRLERGQFSGRVHLGRCFNATNVCLVFFFFRFTVSGALQVNTMFPGLPLQYSLDGGVTWNDVPSGSDVTVPADTEVVVVAR